MLILARHIGETLIIGDNVSVTVLKKKGSFIQIGVNAPKDVTILRSELVKHPPSPLEKNHVEE